MESNDWEDEEEEFESGMSDIALKGGPEFAAFCIDRKRWTLDYDEVVAEFVRVRRKYPVTEEDEECDCDPSDHFAYVVARQLVEAMLISRRDAQRLQDQLSMGFIHYPLEEPPPLLPLPAELIAAIDEFASWPLFSTVGEPVKDARVVTVPSWEAALKASGTNDSVNFGTTLSNRLAAYCVRVRGHAWFQENWNRTVESLQAEFDKKVGPVIRKLSEEYNLPPRFRFLVRGDAVSYALLGIHRDEQASAWMDRIMAQYREGRFPCGFVGNLPPASDDAGQGDDLPSLDGDGKLLVF